jgi:hypothetical protein
MYLDGSNVSGSCGSPTKTDKLAEQLLLYSWFDLKGHSEMSRTAEDDLRTIDRELLVNTRTTHSTIQ